MPDRIRMSHNDEWTKHPIDDAVAAGCNIIEVDVVYSHGKVWASHSRLWFKFLYRASFEDYVRRFPEGKILYIDIKEGSLELARDVYDTLRQYQFKGLVLVGGSGGVISDDCAKYLVYWASIIGSLNIQFLSVFLEMNKIESIDVFGKKRWWMK